MAVKEAQFVAALFHLRMEWDDKTPAEARLMQGQREIPPASEGSVASFLTRIRPTGNLPDEFEQEMLDRMLPSLPAEVKLSWDGIVKFGARRLDDSARGAYEALKLNRNCLLARQLLSLLLAKTDIRKPFGAAAEDAPDVVGIIRREVQTD